MASSTTHRLDALARHTWLTALQASSATHIAAGYRVSCSNVNWRCNLHASSLTRYYAAAFSTSSHASHVTYRSSRAAHTHTASYQLVHYTTATVAQQHLRTLWTTRLRGFASHAAQSVTTVPDDNAVHTPPSLHLDDSRSHLQSVLQHFPPLQWACAYGSGVIKQRGYKADEKPLIDMLFVVDDALQWHAANLQTNRRHYSLLARMLGVRRIAAMQRNYGAGVWFHTNIKVDNILIKYGVVELSTVRTDLQHWSTLYIAGRLQKPVLILNDRTAGVIEKDMFQNCRSALVTALLLLVTSTPPANNTSTLIINKHNLFHSIAQLSYTGDIRMALKAENPHKVSNIVQNNLSAFRELYQPHTDWLQQQQIATLDEHQLQVQSSVSTLHLLVKHLPANIVDHIPLDSHNDRAQLHAAIQSALSQIVKRSSFGQSAKGIVTAGPLSAIV